jgi:WhiB family transcriptional regulator, redox-sensing transcriptional regulator
VFVLGGPNRRHTPEVVVVAVPVAPNPFFHALMIGAECLEVADLVDPPRWHADALCREHPEVDWFPTRGESTEPAKAICRRCLVKTECATWAYGRLDEAGVWGGTSAGDRAQARRLDLTVDELIDAVDHRMAVPTSLTAL